MVTRNEPLVYSTGSRDNSYCGEELTFLGIDEESKIIVLKDARFNHMIDLSYAGAAWDEGWCRFPSTFFARLKEVFFPTK